LGWLAKAGKGDAVIYHSGCVLGGENVFTKVSKLTDKEKAEAKQCSLANELSSFNKITLLQERTSKSEIYKKDGKYMCVLNYIAVKL
jgi:hypothetical protein